MRAPARCSKLNAWRALLALMAVHPLWAQPLIAQQPIAQHQEIEYQIKASYIYNILNFVSFPPDTFEIENTISVCVVGENRFGDSLAELQGAKTPQGKIDIDYLGNFSPSMSLTSCNVIYIVNDNAPKAKKILDAIDTSRTLTIGEYPLFCDDGGVIELFIKDDSIRFKINTKLAQQARYQIYAQLYELGVN